MGKKRIVGSEIPVGGEGKTGVWRGGSGIRRRAEAGRPPPPLFFGWLVGRFRLRRLSPTQLKS